MVRIGQVDEVRVIRADGSIGTARLTVVGVSTPAGSVPVPAAAGQAAAEVSASADDSAETTPVPSA